MGQKLHDVYEAQVSALERRAPVSWSTLTPYQQVSWQVAAAQFARMLGRSVMLLCLCAGALRAASVTLAWDPNPETDVSGYRVYYGTNGFATVVNCGNVTNRTIVDLGPGTWSFYVTCYNTAGLESEPSQVVQWRAGAPPSSPTVRLRR